MSYNIVVSVPKKVIIEGIALSLSGLIRAIQLMNEYAAFTEVGVAIHSSSERVKNILRYLPVQDFKYAEDFQTAALIPFDLDPVTKPDSREDHDDLDDLDDEDEDDEDENGDSEEPVLRTPKIVIKFMN